MSQFIETIRIVDAKIKLLEYHNERFNSTRHLFFCTNQELDLGNSILVPKEFQKGVVKCRIIYDLEIQKIEFSFYQPQNIKHLKMLHADIDYAYKSTDRAQLNQLKEQASPADEVLIIRNGQVSDTSYSNVLFLEKNKWFTPDSPLLAGVQREYLLNIGKVEERKITLADVGRYESIMLINSMLPFGESRAISVRNILK
ncbi:MAG: aminotransferase class IV [Bacteroidales bacterium]|nr:aminotransferase class IV [Bacteroidales bacterium]